MSNEYVLVVVVIAVLVGLYLVLRRVLFGRTAHEELNKVRQDGPGQDESEQRWAWVKHQTLRAQAWTFAGVVVMGVALATYALSHLHFTPKSSPGSEGGTELRWRTHSDRLAEQAITHTTGERETLPGVAALNRVSLESLIDANPTVMLLVDTAKLDEKTRSALAQPISSIDARPQELTLHAAADRLDLSRREVTLALGAAATLKPRQNLIIPSKPLVDPPQWLDWILWSLIGVAAYLLLEVARNYREIPRGRGNFLAETPWYRAQLFTGPLIAFVILFLLTQVDLQLLGDEGGGAIAIDLGRLPPDLLAVPAFLLGFYSRVARKVLDAITRALFRGAWSAAHGEFTIVIKGMRADENEVVSETAVVFEARPAANVTWLASDGAIDAAGAYKAPKVEEPKDVVITAVAEGGGARAVAKVIRVTPPGQGRLEKIEAASDGNALGPGATVAPGKSVSLRLSHNLGQHQIDKISWSKMPEGDQSFKWEGDAVGASVTGSVPTDAPTGTEVDIKAAYEPSKSEVTFKFRVG